MSKAAVNSGCRYETEFSQNGLSSWGQSAGILRPGPEQRGLCWGLSFVWLQQEKSKRDFLKTIRAPAHAPWLAKAAELQRVVQSSKPEPGGLGGPVDERGKSIDLARLAAISRLPDSI
jgi:hypothetical protein